MPTSTVYFHDSALADTFELFSDQKCKDLVYKGDKGNNNVPNEFYGSCKVY